MLLATLIGVALVGVTVVVHGVGSTYWLVSLSNHFPRPEQGWSSRTAMAALTSSAIFLLALHGLEVFVWALTYLALPGLTRLSSVEEALYFSLVTFTTLGYGDIILAAPWRLLSGIEAMVGILLFGWTTAMMFSVIQKVAHAVVVGRKESGDRSVP